MSIRLGCYRLGNRDGNPSGAFGDSDFGKRCPGLKRRARPVNMDCPCGWRFKAVAAFADYAGWLRKD